MELRELGNTGIFVTPVGMGVLTVGRTQLDLNLEEGASIVRYALDKGINFLDTAQYYETYDYIKEALKDSNHKPIIASKSLDYSYDEMKYAVNQALEEMDLEYIDIFLLHEVREAPDFENRSGAWKYLKEAKASGLVKAIGISTHYSDVTEMATERDDMDVIFPLINYDSLGIRRGCKSGIGSESATKEEMAAAIEKASENGIGVFAMKVFGGGSLTRNYIEAMDYVSNLKGMDSMMIGFGCYEDVDKAIEYAEGTIDRNYVPDLSNKEMRIDAGDCEGCGSCIDVCPNKAIFINNNGLAEIDQEICITCGYCAPACPVRALIMFG